MIKIRVKTEKGFQEAAQVSPGCWVDARDIEPQDLERLEKEFGILWELLQDIMDADEQARIEVEDDYTAIIIRVPVFNAVNEIAYFTVPLGIIIFPTKIVTVCQASSDAIEDIAGNRAGYRIRGQVMRSNSSFILNVMGRTAFTFLKALKELNRNSQRIERELQRSVHNNELVQLLSIQKSMVFFETSIKSNEILLEKLKKTPALRLKEEEEDLLEDVITENTQALEMANIYSSILTGTMDAFASVISNNMNIVMKRLTIVNIVLMIPTLIYSFYGMNVGLPFFHLPLAWVGIFIGSLTAAGFGVWMLSRRN
jgi:magnesium transporter